MSRALLTCDNRKVALKCDCKVIASLLADKLSVHPPKYIEMIQHVLLCAAGGPGAAEK